MADIVHKVKIEAPIERVFQAINTEDGLKKWWATDVKMDSSNKNIVLGFRSHSVVLRMRIDESVPNSVVRWTCLGDVYRVEGYQSFL